MDKILEILKAISDRSRLRILMLLYIRPLCVCEIQDVMQITISTVSKHLSILKNVGLVSDEKDGKWVNYFLNKDTQDTILQQVILMLPMWLSGDIEIENDKMKVINVDRIQICSTNLA
jgi:ArsR family transcriptional regulator